MHILTRRVSDDTIRTRIEWKPQRNERRGRHRKR